MTATIRFKGAGPLQSRQLTRARMSIPLDRLDDVFLHMRQALYKAIFRIVRNQAEAEELAQDAYLRARRVMHEANTQNLEAFLWLTARNLALDHLRRQKVRSVFEQRDLDEADLSAVADTQPNVEEQAIHKERLRTYTEALHKLPERARKVWYLNRIEGLPYPEIARRLGVSPNTVFNDMKMAMGVMLDLRARLDRQ